MDAVRVLVSALPVVVLFFKVFSSGFLFHDGLVSDESYYLGFAAWLAEGRPLECGYNITVVNGTYSISLDLRSGGMVFLWGCPQHHMSPEHPAAAKLLFAAVYAASHSYAAVRAAVLALSALSLYALSYTLYRASRLAPAAMAALLLPDNTYPVLAHIAMLDGPMLSALALHMALASAGAYRASAAALAAAAAFKEYAAAFAAPAAYALYRAGDKKAAAIAIAGAAASLAAGYAVYPLIGLSPAPASLTGVLDPNACHAACFFDPSPSWGVFSYSLNPAWVALAIAAAATLLPRGKGTPGLYPAAMCVYTVVLIEVISLARAVYVFYYAPLYIFASASVANVLAALERRYLELLTRVRAP